MLHLIANARVFALEDLDVRHVLAGSGRILAPCDEYPDLPANLADFVELGGRQRVMGQFESTESVQ